MRYYFRFDDVSVNTDQSKLDHMTEFLRNTFTSPHCSCEIVYAVSLMVHKQASCDGVLNLERVFPKILHVESDYRCFYHVQRLGIPEIVNTRKAVIASHGLVHVDHRLLSRKTQEMSIIMSCALLGASTFVPPFHKWNAKTAQICREQDIHLCQYEEGWRHLLYHKFDPAHERYYCHTHDFTYEQFRHQFP